MRAIYGFVYLIRNRVSGKVYIGQTRMGVVRRWITHKSDALLRPKSIFHKAVKKYGPENFDVVELGPAFSLEELNEMEMRAIWTHRSTDREFGYNIAVGGDSSPASEETRKKMSEIRIGMKFTPEHCANMSAARIGKKWSEARRASHRPRKWSPEALAKRVASQTGLKRSADIKARMRESKLNQSPETRAKIAAAHRGRKRSDEDRAKMSEGLRKWAARRRAEAVALLEKEQWSFQN